MLQQLFQKIANDLEKNSIAYMVIGGQAVLIYGEPRLTQDIDITLGVGTERLGDILKLVHNWQWQVLVPDPDDFVRKTMVLPCLDPESELRIDLLFSWSPYEQQALDRVRRVKMGDAQVRFASPEDLIIHKIVAGRPRDLEDVRSILLKNPNLDLSYIRDWLRQFEELLNQSLLQRFEQTLPPK